MEPEKDMILFSVNMIHLKMTLNYTGIILLFMYCVRTLEKEPKERNKRFKCMLCTLNLKQRETD